VTSVDVVGHDPRERDGVLAVHRAAVLSNLVSGAASHERELG
jgi:hypothetical protein